MAASSADALDVVSSVYNYVVTNITYDTAKANSVQSGYLPNCDSVLSQKKGICFDYAAVMTAMLRSQNIPTKLVVGYTGSLYGLMFISRARAGWTISSTLTAMTGN